MSQPLRLTFSLAVAVIGFYAQSASAVTFLTNPGVYTPTASSNFSDFAGQEVPNLFDSSNVTEWAIDGYLGNNPQGRDEGWISIVLNDSYLISHLRFAPRKATSNTDAIDQLSVWVSNSPIGVDVTSAASTNAFLSTAAGLAPSLQLGPFGNHGTPTPPPTPPTPAKLPP